MNSDSADGYGNDVAVICTKNRKDDLLKCLNSILQSNDPPKAVAVIDGGGGVSELELQSLCSVTRPEIGFIYLRSDEYGLVKARNVALDAFEHRFKVIHFFDDDVILGRLYFTELRAFFRTNKPAGAGGLVKVASPSRPHRIFTILGIHVNKPGVILRNGIAAGSDEIKSIHRVAWLPGCAMSFDLDKSRGLRFDIRRSLHPIGEDVDFSCRVAERGALFHVGSAELFHNLSPVNRVSASKWVREDIWHRWLLAEDSLAEVSKWKVISSSILFAFLYVFGGILSLSYVKLAMGLSSMIGVWDLISGKGRLASK